MANVAVTRIVHGDEDGKRIVIEAGEPVKGLPADVVKELKEAGAVAPEKEATAAVGAAQQEEADRLKARVAELEAQLEEARKSDSKPPAPGHPATGGTKTAGEDAKK